MDDDQIKEMVSAIVEAVDYDIWKQLFEEGCIEEPELAEDKALRKHLSEEGLKQAAKFLPENCARSALSVYGKLLTI